MEEKRKDFIEKGKRQRIERKYISIDLKSFYASVECIKRGLDPFDTCLVVADRERTEKTICLAVSPGLKSYGIPGRPRLFEVNSKVFAINEERKRNTPNKNLTGSSYLVSELSKNSGLALDFIAAKPRMAFYMEASTVIYNIYLKYVAPEDIHVYSIDEVFIDATAYLKLNKKSPREFAGMIIEDIFEKTGITATAGIGTNLYLCKVAMDILAKHAKPDKNGVRIVELDEKSYRQLLWTHEPLTDFWRVGKGYATRLWDKGIYTMGDIAKLSMSEAGEDMLYKMFGVNAELLIDHAWGFEPCLISDIKAYKPQSKSLGSSQVLQSAYDFEKAKLVTKEMADALVLELVDKGLVTNQIVLTVGYDIENLINPELKGYYKGEIVTDSYGRKIPKHAHGTANLKSYTSSSKEITKTAAELFERITDKNLLIRRINITANKTISEKQAEEESLYSQLSLFESPEEENEKNKMLKKEKNMQKAMISIKKKFGKNAIIKGMNLEEGATGRDRNRQIGGHKA